MKYKYYFFYLEMALKDPKDLKIYASINISGIPTKKIIEIFKIDLKKDPQIINGYFLTKTQYLKHKRYILDNIGQMNFSLFEYSLMMFVSSDISSIRKFYKKKLIE